MCNAKLRAHQANGRCSRDILLFPFPTFVHMHPSIIDKEGTRFLKTPFLFICIVNTSRPSEDQTSHLDRNAVEV